MSGAEPRDRMRRAIRAVRREGHKAAAIHATAAAVAVLLAVNLAFEAAGASLPDALARSVPLPVAGAGPLPVPVPRTVDASALVALAAGGATAVVVYWLRVRRPAVERFEAVNPPVAEALRTARDAVAAGRESAMADRLYESVLDRLRECSSLGLLDVRRLAAALLVVALLGAGNVGVAVVDLDLGFGADGPADAPDRGPDAGSDDYTGLQDPDQVLGDPEDVSAGSDEVTAAVPARGSGNGSGSPESYGTGGFAGTGEVESQQAGFAESERLEEAELIREYNLRIREEEEG